MPDAMMKKKGFPLLSGWMKLSPNVGLVPVVPFLAKDADLLADKIHSYTYLLCCLARNCKMINLEIFYLKSYYWPELNDACSELLKNYVLCRGAICGTRLEGVGSDGEGRV